MESLYNLKPNLEEAPLFFTQCTQNRLSNSKVLSQLNSKMNQCRGLVESKEKRIQPSNCVYLATEVYLPTLINTNV